MNSKSLSAGKYKIWVVDALVLEALDELLVLSPLCIAMLKIVAIILG